MKVCVISRQQRLIGLCREVLAALGGHRWELIAAESGSTVSSADLFIWDCETPAEASVLQSVHPDGRHLLLVHRCELPRLRDLLGGKICWILLKPVHPAVLRSFVAQSCKLVERMACLEEARDTILDCLLEANLQLQEFDQQRTNFLARAVHDLRAPLMALSGYCGLLLSQQLGPLASGQMEVLRRMQHSIKRLTRIATATLELSTGRLLELQPECQEVDLPACVEQALYEILPLAEEKNLTITVNLEPPARPLVADAFQIEQVLLNLLDNACKFTPKSGSVELRGYSCFWERRNPTVRQHWPAPERRTEQSALANAYRVEIADTGPPVPDAYLKHLFQQHSPWGGTRDRSGGGLGLAICRMIIQAHQGEIFAYNCSGGFTIAFVLPFPASSPALARAEAEDSQACHVGAEQQTRMVI
jgi:signal transduction histidine kinase